MTVNGLRAAATVGTVQAFVPAGAAGYEASTAVFVAPCELRRHSREP
jgi:hypothetical protein